MSPSTPCIGICRLDADGVCVGCGRTMAQIAAWPGMTEAERLRIMSVLPRLEKSANGAGGTFEDESAPKREDAARR